MTLRSIAPMIALGFLTAACGGSVEDPSAATTVDPAASPESTGSLDRNGGWMKGTATDKASGAPLAGVVVAAGGRSATTASDGKYTLQIAAGSYTATATRSGYATATRSVTIRRRETTTVAWSLSPVQAACTYTYGEWGACQQDGTQTRQVLTATPAGCTGTPVLTQSCTAVPPTTPPSGAAFKVFANNDLGMHCVDKQLRGLLHPAPVQRRRRPGGGAAEHREADRPRPDAGERPVLGHRGRDRVDQLDEPREERLLDVRPRPLRREPVARPGTPGHVDAEGRPVRGRDDASVESGHGPLRRAGRSHLPRRRRRQGEPLPAPALLRLRQEGQAARLVRRGPPGLGGDLLPELPRHREGRRPGRNPGVVRRPRPGGPVPAQRPHPPQREEGHESPGAGPLRELPLLAGPRPHRKRPVDRPGRAPQHVGRHARLPRRQDERALRCVRPGGRHRPRGRHAGLLPVPPGRDHAVPPGCDDDHGRLPELPRQHGGGRRPVPAALRGQHRRHERRRRAAPLAGPPALPELPRR